MVKTQGISACEAHAYALVDAEGHRPAHAGNYQTVLAGRGETREIRLIHLLVGRRSVFVARVPSRGQRSLEDLGAGGGIHQVESRIGGNGHFAQAAGVITDHRLFGVSWQVAFLVHMDGRVESQGIGCGDKLHVGSPKSAARIENLDGLVVGDRRGQFQKERVGHAQIVI
jgi:hypothetical protein